MSYHALMGDDDHGVELALLTKCLGALPSVQHVTVWELDTRVRAISTIGSYSVPNYIRKLSSGTCEIAFYRTDHLKTARAVSASTVILLACWLSGVTLTSVEISDLYIERFIRPSEQQQLAPLKELLMYQRIFRTLKTIDLEFSGEDTPTNNGVRANLGKVLEEAVQASSISLKLGDEGRGVLTAPEGSWLSSLLRGDNGESRRKPIFPRLAHLCLSHMICQESELLALIHIHQPVLKSLRLDEISLVRGRNDQSPPCWVRILKKLRTYRMNVYFSGRFTNTSLQWWVVPENWYSLSDESALRSRVYRWMAGYSGEECRLEAAAVKVGNDGEETISARRDFLRGDRSWRLRYRILPEGPVNEDWMPVEEFDDGWDDYALQQGEADLSLSKWWDQMLTTLQAGLQGPSGPIPRSIHPE